MLSSHPKDNGANFEKWLKTSANRPRRDLPETNKRGHYHQPHLEILTAENARRQYNMVQSDMFKKDPEWQDDMPLFGATIPVFHDHPLTMEQERAARRILCVIGHSCEMDYCPILLDLVPLLITILPEEIVYAVVKNMYQHRPFYFGTSHRQFLAVMAAFMDYMHQYFPETASQMSLIGANTEEWLGLIFYRFFVPLIPHKDLIPLLDLYLEDGMCFFFRFGLAVFNDVKWKLKSMMLESSSLWWNQLADYAFDDDEGGGGGLDLEHILDIYGYRVKRKKLDHLIAQRMTEKVEQELIVKQDIDPLQLIDKEEESFSGKSGPRTSTVVTGCGDIASDMTAAAAPSLLLKKRSYLKLLATYLPPTLRQQSLKCCYSTERHGRSLETLYRMCGKLHPCFLILEESDSGHVIGAFCPEPIHPGKTVSGTGACFLFRLSRPAARYSYTTDNARQRREGDIFQLATSKFFALGAGGGDWPGLKIDMELEHGSSHPCTTFNNLPLCGRGQEIFRIHRVQVYHLTSAAVSTSTSS